MAKWINHLMAKARRYTVVDFAFLKLALLSIGILLGSYFTAFFQNYILIVWIVAAVSYTVVIYATFGKR